MSVMSHSVGRIAEDGLLADVHNVA